MIIAMNFHDDWTSCSWGDAVCSNTLPTADKSRSQKLMPNCGLCGISFIRSHKTPQVRVIRCISFMRSNIKNPIKLPVILSVSFICSNKIKNRWVSHGMCHLSTWYLDTSLLMSLSYICVVIIEVYLRGRTRPGNVCPAVVGSSFNMSVKTKTILSTFWLRLICRRLGRLRLGIFRLGIAMNGKGYLIILSMNDELHTHDLPQIWKCKYRMCFVNCIVSTFVC